MSRGQCCSATLRSRSAGQDAADCGGTSFEPGGVVDSAGFVSTLGVDVFAALGFKVVTVRFFVGAGASLVLVLDDVSPVFAAGSASVATICAST